MLDLRPDLVDMSTLADPAALEAIHADCVGATAESGRRRKFGFRGNAVGIGDALPAGDSNSHSACLSGVVDATR
jgi:hypothetical protein